jgi:hypothetical protein
MKRFPDGSVLYEDSPWFLEIALFGFAGALGAAIWRILTQHPPEYVMAVLLSIFVAICILGMLVQQYRTFLFDPSVATMRWTARGLFGRSSGEVAYKDIQVGVDTSAAGQTPTYRVMLTTPTGSMPLVQGYVSDRTGVEKKAEELRALLGQTSDSLQADSIQQMVQTGNKIGVVAMLRDQSSMSLEDDVRRIDDGST